MDFSTPPRLADSPMVAIAGFGMLDHADGYLRIPPDESGVAAVFHEAKATGRRVVLRGGGRSYGDASVAAESLVLSLARMNRILKWNPLTGILEAEGGATLANIWQYALPDGFWLPVASGTMYPTLAGALAMNIHGKNNWHSGTLAEHVISMDVLTPDGECHEVGLGHPWFYAFAGGWGLAGVIMRVTLRLRRISSGNLNVLNRAVANWDEQFAAFKEFAASDYAVSWVDGFGAGRGIFQSANHVSGHEPLSLEVSAQIPSPTLAMGVRRDQAWRILKRFTNRWGMKTLAAARYTVAQRLGPDRNRATTLIDFHFPLDYIPNWERAYRPGGLRQFQACVPGVTAAQVIPELLRRCQSDRLEPYLAVLKRHRADESMLPYLVNGYSIALDFHQHAGNASRLRGLYRSLAKTALDGGGRIYMAKDSWLTQDEIVRSLGAENWNRFADMKRNLDPDGLLTSNLGVRAGLC